MNFELIFVTILREYFEIEYSSLSNQMKIPFDLQNVLKDFVFLFFFIGNDFLPRCMAYNIRENSIEHLITAFKQFLTTTTSYVVGENELNIHAMALLSYCISQYESRFLTDKAAETEKYLKEQEKK